MKKIIQKILKKYKLQFVIVLSFIAINMYLLTVPPQIIGNIVDLLYHVDENKDLIIKQTIYLILTAIALLLVRLPWRYSVGIIARGFEKDIKNKLFDQFMKIKMISLQNIKNGELMSYFTKDIGEIRVFLYRAVSLRFQNYDNIFHGNLQNDVWCGFKINFGNHVSNCCYKFSCSNY